MKFATRAERLEAFVDVLSGIGQELGLSLDLPNLARTAYRHIARVLDAEMCYLGVYDAASQSVEVVWQIHGGKELPGGRFPLGSGFTSRVIQTGQPVLISEWSREGPPVAVQYATERAGLPESTITVPIKRAQSVLGVLSVQSYWSSAFDTEDVALLMGVADTMARVIEALHPSLRPRDDAAPSAQDPETILASLKDALLVVDADGRLVRLNRAARDLLCMDGASLVVGERLERAYESGESGAADELVTTLWPMMAQAQRDQVAVEAEVATSGAPQRVYHVRAAPLWAQPGSRSGGMIVVHEVGSGILA